MSSSAQGISRGPRPGLQHPRVGAAQEQPLDERAALHAEPLGQAQTLDHRGDVRPQQHVVDQLRRLTRPGPADVHDVGAERPQHAGRPGQHLGVATDEGEQRPLCGRRGRRGTAGCPAGGRRRAPRSRAAGASPRGRPSSTPGRRGRARRAAAGRRTDQDVADRPAAGRHQDDVALPQRLRRPPRGAPAPAASRSGVVAQDVVTRCGEVPGHRSAHAAQAEDADPSRAVFGHMVRLSDPVSGCGRDLFAHVFSARDRDRVGRGDGQRARRRAPRRAAPPSSPPSAGAATGPGASPSTPAWSSSTTSTRSSGARLCCCPSCRRRTPVPPARTSSSAPCTARACGRCSST